MLRFVKSRRHWPGTRSRTNVSLGGPCLRNCIANRTNLNPVNLRCRSQNFDVEFKLTPQFFSLETGNVFVSPTSQPLSNHITCTEFTAAVHGFRSRRSKVSQVLCLAGDQCESAIL